MNFYTLLKIAIERDASDLHLSAGKPPILRIDGRIQFLASYDALSVAHIEKILRPLMTDAQYMQWQNNQEIDFSLAECRIHIFKEKSNMAAAVRIFSHSIKSLDEIGAPGVLKKLLQHKNGLILVVGAVGSGKTTTLAAMIDYLNKTRAAHIITIEDPIELIHESQKCLVHQRQLGQDTLSFTSALRAALREDPDVIMVGEIRDEEAMRMLLTAATTGHLILASMHTGSVLQAIRRITEMFAASEKSFVKNNLADSLTAIISQTLITKESGGRFAKFEVMLVTPAIRNLIREEKYSQICSLMPAQLYAEKLE